MVNIPTSPADYQSISVFPIVLKVYEKLIWSQVTTFTENKLIYLKYQSGYKNNNFTFNNVMEQQ